ncbi:MAG TPA: response regulator [Saprospiraceae bacterium]|nr:response regulator [Saprospiraceae bacterium]
MLAPKVIMIVDDDPDDVAFFCEALSEIDTSIRCIGVKGAEEALWLLKKNSDNYPDFIFLDLNMPKMNGKQCLKQIKSDINLSSIPVVVYTTSKTREDIAEAKKLGAHYFLTKPNKFAELKTAIKFIIEKKCDEIS